MSADNLRETTLGDTLANAWAECPHTPSFCRECMVPAVLAVVSPEIEQLRDRLRVEEEAERLLAEHNDALQACLDAVRALAYDEARWNAAIDLDQEGCGDLYDLMGDLRAALDTDRSAP